MKWSFSKKFKNNTLIRQVCQQCGLQVFANTWRVSMKNFETGGRIDRYLQKHETWKITMYIYRIDDWWVFDGVVHVVVWRGTVCCLHFGVLRRAKISAVGAREEDRSSVVVGLRKRVFAQVFTRPYHWGWEGVTSSHHAGTREPLPPCCCLCPALSSRSSVACIDRLDKGTDHRLSNLARNYYSQLAGPRESIECD